MNNTLDLLKELTSAVAVSGAEDNIVELLKNNLSQYGDVTVDAMKNVSCTFGQGYHFLLDAHIDEIGFIVTDITDDGFIKFDKIGGFNVNMLPASEVSVWGTKEIKGIVSTLPPHLQTEDNKSVKITDLSIDTGLDKVSLEKVVSLGDRITLKRKFTPLLNNRVSSSCLDDRSGVAAILMALDELKTLPCKITVLFSAQEEAGTRGAKSGAFNNNADEAIVVDVSFAMSPSCDKAECGELSKGPMIGFSPILDKEISSKLVSVSEKYNIPYQKEIMSGRTGTNADVISVSQNGIKSALISIPERYMHQPVEVVDTADVENVSKLICAYIRERIGEPNA